MPPRSRMALALTTALLALALLPAATWGQSPSPISFEPMEDGLRLSISDSPPPGSYLVAISHEDPTEGRIIDRVVPIAIDTGRDTVVELRDVRDGVNLTAQLLESDPDVQVPADPGRLLEFVDGLVERASQTLPPLAPPTGGDRIAMGYPVSTRPLSGPLRLLLTAEGLLVAAWGHSSGDEWGYFSAFHVTVSSDAGHTFGPSTMITDRYPNAVAPWAWGLDGQGRVVLVYGESEPPSGGYARSTVLVRFDPKTQQVVSREAFPATIHGHADLEPQPDGSLLLAAMGVDHGGSRASQPQIWRVPISGAPSLVATLQGPATDTSNHHIDLETRGSNVMAVWRNVSSGPQPDPRSWLHASRSTDGGASFEPAWPIDLGAHRTNAYSAPQLALDATGTAHMLAMAFPKGKGTPGDYASFESDDVTTLYIRVPPVGRSALVTEVDGPYAGTLVPSSIRSTWPFLSVRDGRVWIFINSLERFADGTGQLHLYAVESLDGGTTFSSPFAVTNLQGQSIMDPRDAVTLPGGRPAVYALYRYGNGDLLPSIIPVFDPLPSLASGLVKVAQVDRGVGSATTLAPTTPIPSTAAQEVARLKAVTASVSTLAPAAEGTPTGQTPTTTPTSTPGPGPWLAAAALALVALLGRRVGGPNA